jgi:hypothetical protein
MKIVELVSTALKERLDGTTDCTASDLKKEFLGKIIGQLFF